MRIHRRADVLLSFVCGHDRQQGDHAMAINFRQSPFENLEPKLRASVEASLVQQDFKRGETILRQSGSFTGIVWLRSGVGMAERRRPDDSLEYSSPLHWGVWGTEALLKGSYLGTLIAATPCVASVLPAHDAHRFNADPAFSKLVADWLSDDFSLSVKAMSALSASRTDERVMDFLSYVYRQAARDTARSVSGQHGSVAWPFSVGQLAQFVSVSRPHLSTILSRLSAEGKLSLAGRRLAIPAIADELRKGAANTAAPLKR